MWTATLISAPTTTPTDRTEAPGDCELPDPGNADLGADGTVTLAGLVAGTTITYATAGDYNRVLIENDGTKGCGTRPTPLFDIGGFTISA